MSTVSRRTVITLASVAALAGAAAPTLAQAAPATSATGSDAVVVHTFAQQEGAAEYWTPARMKNAKSKDMGKKVGHYKAGVQQAPGAPVVVAGQGAAKPTGKPTRPGKTPTGAAVQETPKPTIGKVFFTLGGVDYVCSANSVSSANGSTVATAGHCANEGPGAYATRFVFVPAYDNGAAPYGKWTAVNSYAPAAWVNSGDMNVDTAFVVVAKLNGATLSQTVGGTGVAFNQPRGLTYKAFGYPAARPYDGQTLWSCVGTAFANPVDRTSQSQGIPCSMTGGSSGGPWFIGTSYNGTASVQNSVNSFGYPTLGDYMFGPYWGTTIQETYNTASATPVA